MRQKINRREENRLKAIASSILLVIVLLGWIFPIILVILFGIAVIGSFLSFVLFGYRN